MALRTINYAVTVSEISPKSPQYGGIQGDRNATDVIFTLDAALVTAIATEKTALETDSGETYTLAYRIDLHDGSGGYYPSQSLIPVDSKITYSLEKNPVGGVSTLYLIISLIDSDNMESVVLYSYPASVKIASSLQGTPTESEVLQEISGAIAEARAEADRATEQANLVGTAEEVIRRESELQRIESEVSRVADESDRATAESIRVNSENSRISAESSRVTAETARATLYSEYDTKLTENNLKADTATQKADAMASGSPKGIYTTLALLQAAYPTGATGAYLVTEDGKWYYWNGSSWAAGGVYQSTGIPNGSLLTKQFSFVPVSGKIGKNLFDKDNITTGYYVSYSNGVLISNASYCASDYIAVTPSVKYCLTYSNQGVFFDSSKVVISGSGFTSTSNGVTITAPSNAAYVRISTLLTNLATQQIEIGTVVTAYELYRGVVDLSKVSDIELTSKINNIVPNLTPNFSNTLLSNKLINIFNVKGSKNLFNKETATLNSVILTGTITASADYCVSDYIPVTSGLYYTITRITTDSIVMSCYDVNKTYLSQSVINGANTFVMPTAAYVRIDVHTADINVYQLEKGKGQTTYANAYSLTPYKQNVVTVAKSGGDFTTINGAVKSIQEDTESNPYTILVYPGTYKEVVQILGANRYISIIGVDKSNCIIRDDSGDYANSPLYFQSGGYIANLTIIATHDDNPTNINGKAYAVHSDGYGQCVFEAFNCKMISYQMAAIGSGTSQDKTIILTQCEFISYTDATSTWLPNGALWCHSAISSSDTNQHLIVKDCKCYSENGRAIFINDVGGGAGMDVTFYNSIAYSKTLGKTDVVTFISSTITLCPDSYGNNIAVLNA